MIKQLSTFILDRVGTVQSYWVRDVNCFVGHIPIENINGLKVEGMDRICAILFNTPAALVGDLPDRADQQVQIWNRHNSWHKAREDAMAFFEVLHGGSQWDLPVIESGDNYNAMIIDGVASPAPIQNPDSKGRFVFSTNYLFRVCNP